MWVVREIFDFQTLFVTEFQYLSLLCCNPKNFDLQQFKTYEDSNEVLINHAHISIKRWNYYYFSASGNWEFRGEVIDARVRVPTRFCEPSAILYMHTYLYISCGTYLIFFTNLSFFIFVNMWEDLGSSTKRKNVRSTLNLPSEDHHYNSFWSLKTRTTLFQAFSYLLMYPNSSWILQMMNLLEKEKMQRNHDSWRRYIRVMVHQAKF